MDAICFVPFTWTEDKVYLLRQLASEGWSASQMSASLGCSRNAVIGKLHREQIPHNRSRQALSEKERAESKERRRKLHTIAERKRFAMRRAEKPTLRVIAEARKTNVIPLRIGFLDIDQDQCRWICDEPGEDGLALFCGHKTITDASYCLGHFWVTHERRA